MHRFLLREGDVVDERVFVIISEELRNQWMKVLRFRVGEKVILFQDDGKEYMGEITSILPKIIQGTVMSISTCETELPTKIILAQSILKNPEKFEWILQKGTELGVSEFYPIIMRRTERQFLPKLERLQRILVEATEQCGRCVVPALHEPMKLEAFLKMVVKEKSLILIPHTVATVPVSDVKIAGKKSMVLCVGPEGGFDDKEVDDVKKAGGISVTLGKRILRSETAALAAVTLLASRIE